MPAIDALLRQRAMFDELDSPIWQGLARGFINTSRDQYVASVFHGDRPEWMTTGPQMTAEIRRALRMAQTFTVTPQMSALVDGEADAWQSTDRWSLSDFPCTAGFMWLPQPVSDIGVDGYPTSCSAILWHLVGGRLRAILLYAKTHPGVLELTEDNEAQIAFSDLPYLLPLQIYDINPDLLPSSVALNKPLPPEMRADIRVWLDNDQLAGDGTIRAERWMRDNDARFEERPDRIMCWLVSALRIMREPIASVEKAGVPAKVRKEVRARKMRNPSVTVIELRRVLSANGGGTHQLHVRYYRRGHTRRVWFKDPETREWARREVWIEPTIVGDPTLPLVMREHVNQLRR